jgi:hypothetical protein
LKLNPVENKAELPNGLAGLQVGKGFGTCSLGYWLNDRLTSKACGGEERGMWFLKCLFWLSESLSWWQGWEQQEVCSIAEASARAKETGTNEPEERKQLRWRQNAFEISFFPTPCIHGNRRGSRVYVLEEKQALQSNKSVCGSFLCKPGLWDLACDVFLV